MNKNHNNKCLYFEYIGENFDNWMSEYDVSARIKLINKYLPDHPKEKSDLSCLEIGCGTGKISAGLAKCFKNLHVSDLSEKLSESVGKFLNVKFSAENACSLSFNNKKFDYIISSECIEHTPRPKEALLEMTRVLKVGGRIIVTSPNKLWYPALWFSNKFSMRNYKGIENWIFPQYGKKILEDAGLKILYIDGCHLFPWQLPFAKKILPFFDKFSKFLFPVMINFCIVAEKS